MSNAPCMSINGSRFQSRSHWFSCKYIYQRFPLLRGERKHPSVYAPPRSGEKPQGVDATSVRVVVPYPGTSGHVFFFFRGFCREGLGATPRVDLVFFHWAPKTGR